MAIPANPALHPRWARGWRVSRNVAICLLAVAAVLLAARIALPFVLRHEINQRLAAIPDYNGWVDKVGVSMWRGAYTLYSPVILKRDGHVKEPFFRAEEIDFSIAWRELFHGKLVGDIVARRPMLTFVAAESPESSQMTADHRWQDVITDIFPIRITLLRLTDGELRYVNRRVNPKVDVRVAHLDALATGLRNRPDESGDEFPARIDARGETIGGGHLTILTQLEPLAKDPHFLLKLKLEDVSLPALNDFLRAYGGVDVSAGVFNGYVEATARNGRFDGYFKPFFAKIDFSAPPGTSRPVGQELWESMVRGFAWVFKNHARDQVATRIPFSGEFKSVEIRKWATFANLVRHAFIQPLGMKLDSATSPGASPAPGK